MGKESLSPLQKLLDGPHVQNAEEAVDVEDEPGEPLAIGLEIPIL